MPLAHAIRDPKFTIVPSANESCMKLLYCDSSIFVQKTKPQYSALQSCLHFLRACCIFSHIQHNLALLFPHFTYIISTLLYFYQQPVISIGVWQLLSRARYTFYLHDAMLVRSLPSKDVCTPVCL